MHPVRLTLAGLFVFLSTFSREAPAQQVLTNGDLETFSNGNPDFWTYVPGADGPATIESTAFSSPFTNVYPLSTRSVLFTDGGLASSEPRMLQTFTNDSEPVTFGFDFQITSPLTGEPWYCLPGDRDPMGTAFLINILIDASGTFRLSDRSGAFSAPLSAFTWYQVTMTFSDSMYSGSITPFDGVPITWTDRLTQIRGGELHVDSIRFQDASTRPSSDLAIDNVFVAIVPEPGTAVWPTALCLTIALRRAGPRRT